MYMRKITIILTLLAALLAGSSYAQKTNPTATYTNTDGETLEVTTIEDGEAPLDVTFKANPEDMENHTASYEWHFKRQGEDTDFIVRYEEETTYRFSESGTFEVTLATTVDGESLAESDAIKVTISESRLEFPNAFSPNGDGYNDIYRAKRDSEGRPLYRSIVEFHAWIFNRWGQKLYDWTDISSGWDGTFNGKDVKEGVYFVLVKAKGADGRNYNIKKDVNLIRHYTEGSSTGSSDTE